MELSKLDSMLNEILSDIDKLYLYCTKEFDFGVPLFQKATSLQLWEIFQKIDTPFFQNLVFIEYLIKDDLTPTMSEWLSLWNERMLKQGDELKNAIMVAAAADNLPPKELARTLLKRILLVSDALAADFKSELQHLFHLKIVKKTEQQNPEAESGKKPFGSTGSSINFDMLANLFKSMGFSIKREDMIENLQQALFALTGQNFSEEEITTFKWMSHLPKELMDRAKSPDFIQGMLNQFHKMKGTKQDEDFQEDPTNEKENHKE